MPACILFDDGISTLAPLTDFRPAFEVRTGAMRTIDRLRLSLKLTLVGLRVPEGLAGVTRERFAAPVNDASGLATDSGGVVLLNGRCVLATPEVVGVVSSPVGGCVVDSATGVLVAACVSGEQARAFMAGGAVPTAGAGAFAAPLLTRPWSVRTHRDKCLAADLHLLAAEMASTRLNAPRPGVLVIGDKGLTMHPTATVYPGAVLDVESGPIVLDERSVVRPGAIVIGPAYVGPHSTVLERATLRQQTAIGPHCKVNGEVGGTIFQGFSNKAHDGYLGDSFVGEWVNLGAGTTNSNLLNTYGEVVSVAAPGGSYERTGEQFLGAIIGDHVKAAICTRIMTGSVLHTGSMFATTAAVSGCVPGFTWATDAGHRPYRLEKFTEVMRAAMARRKVEASEAYLRRLAEVHGRK